MEAPVAAARDGAGPSAAGELSLDLEIVIVPEIAEIHHIALCFHLFPNSGEMELNGPQFGVHRLGSTGH